jgi:hypothetical protein
LVIKAALGVKVVLEKQTGLISSTFLKESLGSNLIQDGKHECNWTRGNIYDDGLALGK